jgi:biotin synthase
MEREICISDKREIVGQLTQSDTAALIRRADVVRKTCCGEEVHIRGIIEFSNHCCRSCLYCGLRRENEKITRYRMTPAEIKGLSNEIIRRGVKTVVLQSGDDFGYSRETLADLIHDIKKAHPAVAVTLSLGERPFDDYKAFKDAGADRYLLKHETANPELYERLHPGQTLRKRMEILEYLTKLGYQTGAGTIVGLPGQTPDDIAEDILLMKKLDVDMAGIGPFVPQSGTPLKNCPAGDLHVTLKTLALTRIVTKNIHLPATTALAALDPVNGQVSGLKAGANVIMPDFTPDRYRTEYRIYDGKIAVNLETAERIITAAGRKTSFKRGDSSKCKKHHEAFACI